MLVMGKRIVLLNQAILMVVIFLMALGCKSSEKTGSDVKEAIFTDDGTKLSSDTVGWQYRGPMKRMSDIKMTLSITGHTLRVEGHLLNDEGNRRLSPAEIKDLAEGPRPLDYLYYNEKTKKYFVIYPVATAKSEDKDGNKVENEPPGYYSFISATPRRNYQKAYYEKDGITVKYSAHTWHNLPYLGYADNGTIAFHSAFSKSGSPSSQAKKGDWIHLYRGDVSMGCKRMPVEHILELAWILGAGNKDFADPAVNRGRGFARKINKNGEGRRFIQVLGVGVYDEVNGHVVESEFPHYPWANDKEPFENSKIYKAWSLGEPQHSKNICAFIGKSMQESTCEDIPKENVRDQWVGARFTEGRPEGWEPAAQNLPGR